jgi:hypothetical protein
MAKPKLGSGERFAALKKKVAAGGARNPGAVAASIGRKKYGAVKMANMSAAGRRSAHGSGPFSASEQKQGYKVMYGASDLHAMEVDTMQGVEGYTLAKRRDAFKGSFGNRRTLRRSEGRE